MSKIYDLDDLSNNSITTREEAQDFTEQFARTLLPAVAEKLRSAVHQASKPDDVLKLADKIRSLAQVRQTSDTSAIAAGAAMGAAISGKAFAEAFQAIGKSYGVEVERDVSEDLQFMKEEFIEKSDKVEEVEIIEKLDTIDTSDIIDSVEEIDEINPFE